MGRAESQKGLRVTDSVVLHAGTYLESSQILSNLASRTWPHNDLLTAAERASLRNTGWPIGLVIRAQGVELVPTEDGIKARINRQRGGPWTDYWSFRKDGSYYVARLFEEEHDTPSFVTSAGHPAGPLWFDVRIWRIAEVLLHSAALYRELGIGPEETYILGINHRGLAGREFWTSRGGMFVNRGRFCRVDVASWSGEVTQDYIVSNLKELTATVASELFALFDFAQMAPELISEITDQFLNSRL